MLLSQYLTVTRSLIQTPQSPVPLITDQLLTLYINMARSQAAAEGECIRDFSLLNLTTGLAAYGFADIVPGLPGIQQVMTVRLISINGHMLDMRPWEWFWAYYGPQGTAAGTPAVAAQARQGTAGNLVFNPIPDAAYTVDLDTVCLPEPLVDDTTVDALPYPWTEAVPFWTAWLAMQSFQRQADADMMMERYQVLMRRARGQSVPSVLPGNLPGDLGTQLAAAKTTMTAPPAAIGAAPGRGGG